MDSLSHFDLIILGGGSAGYAAARTASAGGLKVAVVEGGRQIAGLCILRGCMPTKTLLQSAEVYHQSRKAGVWGIQIPKVTYDWSAIMDRKTQLVQDWASYRESQLNGGRFTLIRSQARFLDSHHIEIDSGERIHASHFIISTGSTISMPDIPGLRECGAMTSDDALALKHPPQSMIILGGGPVAVELAQFFCRMDVEVTLIQRSSHLLKENDPDASTVIEQALRSEGMNLFTGTSISSCTQNAQGQKKVTFEHQGKSVTVQADCLLNALGRHPQTADLQLDRAGIKAPKGRVETSPTQQTNVPHIYAAGDCCGPYEIVHLAVQQGEVAAHNILCPGQPRSMDYRLLTTVVFTDPQLATVGLTERSASRAGIPFLSASYLFADHGKSVILDAHRGFVKLLADRKSGEIIGGCVVGPMGGELIHEIVVAMSQSMTVHELASVPHYHPTLAEIWTYPAEELADQIPRN